MAAIVLPAGFNLIAGVVGASFIVHHVYMPMGVVQARKKYGIKYPSLYADRDNCKNEDHIQQFNAVQRGHQNSLENQPIFLAALIVAGTKNPITASALGMIYLFGKCLYFAGYSTGDVNKRMNGAPAYIGVFGLVGICLTMGVKAVMTLWA